MPSTSGFTSFDWMVVIAYVAACSAAGLWVRRYASKLDHFIVAGREVSLYLGIASLAATEFGLVTAMYTAQYGYRAGFAPILIGVFFAVPMLVMGKTGFVVEKLRATGAATIAEALERKFGPDVRWWAGLIVALSGILNMGIFLRVGGEFVVTFTGIGDRALEIGGLRLGYLELIMSGLVGVVLLYTVAGGMLSVLVTDLLQFLILGAGLVLVTVLCLHRVGWDAMVAKVSAVHGAGGFNPFECEALGGWSGLLFWILVTFGVQCTQQTTIARVLAAKDAATAARIYRWTGFYYVGRWALPIVWGVLALCLLDPAAYPVNDPVASRLAMPAALAQILPVGVAGVVLAAMLAAEMSTDSSYMLCWATVIVHDVVKPKCRTPLTPKAELRLTRLVVVAIGVFLLVFGLWYEIPGAVFDYLGLTATIYLSGVTTLLVAALYWPRATRTGAYAALGLGAAAPIAWLAYDLARRYGGASWPEVSGTSAGLTAFALAAAGMVAGSLLTEPEMWEGPPGPDSRPAGRGRKPAPTLALSGKED